MPGTPAHSLQARAVLTPASQGARQLRLYFWVPGPGPRVGTIASLGPIRRRSPTRSSFFCGGTTAIVCATAAAPPPFFRQSLSLKADNRGALLVTANLVGSADKAVVSSVSFQSTRNDHVYAGEVHGPCGVSLGTVMPSPRSAHQSDHDKWGMGDIQVSSILPVVCNRKK